ATDEASARAQVQAGRAVAEADQCRHGLGIAGLHGAAEHTRQVDGWFQPHLRRVEVERPGAELDHRIVRVLGAVLPSRHRAGPYPISPEGCRARYDAVERRVREVCMASHESPYWNPRHETMPRSELEALQVRKLMNLVEWADASVPWQSKRLRDAG